MNLISHPPGRSFIFVHPRIYKRVMIWHDVSESMDDHTSGFMAASIFKETGFDPRGITRYTHQATGTQFYLSPDRNRNPVDAT
jgi:hypothetical protein